MDWKLEDPNLVAGVENLLDGTYFASYTNITEESKELTARVSIEGWWKDTAITVYFPPIVDDTEPEQNQPETIEENTDQSQSNSAGEEDDAGFEMDLGSIAFIAMLLLFNVGIVAAILAARSKSKKKGDGRERAMAAFERDLFAETGPVTSAPTISEVDTTEPVLDSNAPPLPADGLPPGWTMEQWSHYGAQWLAQQASTVPVAEPAPVQPVTPTVPDLPSIEDLLG